MNPGRRNGKPAGQAMGPALPAARCRACGSTRSFAIVSGSSDISLDVPANLTFTDKELYPMAREYVRKSEKCASLFKGYPDMITYMTLLIRAWQHDTKTGALTTAHRIMLL